MVNVKDWNEIVEPLGMKLSVREVREIYFDYLDILNFISAIDTNTINLSISDYQDLPAITVDLLTQYKNEKAKMMEEKMKVK